MRYLLILLFVFQYALSYEMFKGCEYKIVEENSITLGWDNNDPSAEFYDIYSVWIDPDPPFEKYLGRTSENTFKVLRDRPGHFVYKVRSGFWDNDQQKEILSSFAHSDDESCGIVDGQPMGWRVYWKIKPLVIIIE